MRFSLPFALLATVALGCTQGPAGREPSTPKLADTWELAGLKLGMPEANANAVLMNLCWGVPGDHDGCTGTPVVAGVVPRISLHFFDARLAKISMVVLDRRWARQVIDALYLKYGAPKYASDTFRRWQPDDSVEITVSYDEHVSLLEYQDSRLVAAESEAVHRDRMQRAREAAKGL